MHMNSAPHLLDEDRPEFERVLDQALRTADHDPELAAAIGQRLNAEQLRAMARSAVTAISACAAVEYQTYVKARGALRALSANARPQPVSAGGAHGDEGALDEGPDSATTDREPIGSAGAGAGAVLAVLAPVLAGIAALLFLVIGYVLRTLDTEPAVADPMVTIGWWFAGLTAAGAFVAMVGMVVTALRNGVGEGSDARGVGLTEESERAHEAWRQALLHRGILPFLREALADAPPAPPASSASPAPPSSFVPRRPESHSRTPQLGYSRPGFSSTDSESTPSTRPSYTSPDFTSPDYGAARERPE
ncbi:hypothetical protein [Streptomyces albireticuli]|nr:hypothetical protein [Streptomyces albireticuli]MCD9143728.1 hypothetical protein [Streptomyces albireticuli]MCD9161841.1 hypothetical protein [Streptomyces albireticuli]MCD9191845.1 hypothetical protein [Streptomyces albireticuli]